MNKFPNKWKIPKKNKKRLVKKILIIPKRESLSAFTLIEIWILVNSLNFSYFNYL
jgi:hypothetical protein